MVQRVLVRTSFCIAFSSSIFDLCMLLLDETGVGVFDNLVGKVSAAGDLFIFFGCGWSFTAASTSTAVASIATLLDS